MASIQPRSFVFTRNVAALAVLAGATTLGAYAQQSVQPQVAAVDSSLFAAASTRPMDLATLAGVDYSSSSSSVDVALPTDPGSLNFTSSALQPPPRRRYGRPRYNDNMHNSDGSNKYVFEGAVGMTLPTGNTYHYFNTSYGFQAGGGRQFNKKFAVLAQFDYDRFGINKNTLDNQLSLYTVLCPDSDTTCLTPSTLDGSNHVWSFTVNPTYTFYQGDKYGAYAVVGAGFYHKVTDFLTPQEGEYCDPYYGICEDYVANALYDHYTSNAVGFNGGIGLTYKFSRFADERLFIEARYVFVDNSQRTGYTNANVDTTTYAGNDAFPANSNRTTYIPIKVGIRF
jgi:hypothetical protein